MRRIHLVAVGSLAVSLAACNAHIQSAGPPPREAKSLAQVGSVGVDVVSLTNWNQVEKDFKPAYGLSGSQALTNVGAINGSNVAANVNSLGFGLGGAVAGVTRNNQTTNETPQGGGAATTSVNDTRQVKTPDVPQSAPTNSSSVTLVTAPTNLTGSTAPSLPAMVTLVTADSYLRYANVLEQGVAELAHKSDSTAFLALFKISVIPNHRNEPYDLLLDLSVVPGTVSLDGRDPDNGPAPQDPAPCDTNSPPPAGQSSDAKPPNCQILVLPFVADALQNTEEDWTAQAVRSAALSLSAQAGPVALNSSFQALQELLDHSQAIRPNSLLTVQKISGGNIRVRMGALRIGDDAYELQSMTHDVAVLLFVPNSYIIGTTPCDSEKCLEKRLTVLGLIRYADARNDADKPDKLDINKKSPIDEFSDEDRLLRFDRLQAIAKFLDMYKWPNSIIDGCAEGSYQEENDPCKNLRELTKFVNRSDYAGFFNKLSGASNDPNRYTVIPRLWAYLLDFAGNVGDPRFINQIFSIPGRSPEISCPTSQTALAYPDSGKTQLNIDLAGGRNLAEKTVLSELHLGGNIFASESTNSGDTLDEQHFHYMTGVIDETAVSKKGTILNLTISDPVYGNSTPCGSFSIRAGKAAIAPTGAHAANKAVKKASAQKSPAKKAVVKAT